MPTCDCVSMPVWCPICSSVSASSEAGWGQWRISHCLQRLLCLHQYACMHSCLSVSAFLCHTKQCVVEKHVLLVLGGNHFSQGMFAAHCWCTVHSLCVLLRGGVLANHRRICENHYFHMYIIFKRAVKIESVFNMCVTIMPFLCLLESFTFTVFHSLNRSGIYNSKVLPSYIQLQLQLHWLYSAMTSFRKW